MRKLRHSEHVHTSLQYISLLDKATHENDVPFHHHERTKHDEELQWGHFSSRSPLLVSLSLSQSKQATLVRHARFSHVRRRKEHIHDACLA
jgi:hypothetical protein